MFASIICEFLGSGGKKNVCKSCARKATVQTLCKSNSPRNLCKPCANFTDSPAHGKKSCRHRTKRSPQVFCGARAGHSKSALSGYAHHCRQMETMDTSE